MGDSAHTQLAGTTFSARCSIAGCWRHVKFLHKLAKLKLDPSDARRVRVGGSESESGRPTNRALAGRAQAAKRA